jgi:ring-1,2-phenylacetyl-CoA epoxidase subunit PaaA
MADKVAVEDTTALQQMPDEYRELLVKQLLAHAEGELNGGDNYIMFAAPMSPDAFELKICYSNAADEIDHYLRTARLLEDIGIDCSYMLKQRLDARRSYPTELLNGSHRDKASWIARGMTSLLAEGAAIEIIEEMTESSYAPFAAICPRIFDEEKIHIAHGLRITRDACRNGSTGEVQNALDLIWPMALDLFGRGRSERSAKYVTWGLRTYSNEDARQRFIEKTKPTLQALGLTPPNDQSNRRFL